MLKISFYKINTFLLTIISLFFVNNSAYADSPLTSTNFAVSYQDIEVINQAIQDKKLDKKALKFLISNAPLDEKAALINALGWNFDGQNNGYLFLIQLSKSKKIDIDKLSFKNLTTSDKFVLGYLLDISNN